MYETWYFTLKSRDRRSRGFSSEISSRERLLKSKILQKCSCPSFAWVRFVAQGVYGKIIYWIHVVLAVGLFHIEGVVLQNISEVFYRGFRLWAEFRTRSVNEVSWNVIDFALQNNVNWFPIDSCIFLVCFGVEYTISWTTECKLIIPKRFILSFSHTDKGLTHEWQSSRYLQRAMTTHCLANHFWPWPGERSRLLNGPLINLPSSQ